MIPYYSFTSAAISSTKSSISVRLSLIPLLRKASTILLRVSSPLSGANKTPAAAPTTAPPRNAAKILKLFIVLLIFEHYKTNK